MMTIDQQVLDANATRNISCPRLADFPIATVEKLGFADTDRNGHITNTVFAVRCQNARMELLRDRARVPIPSNSQFVIAKLVLEFRAEMHWPRTVEIATSVERVERSSATLSQALFVHDRCVAIADSVVALMSTATRQSIVLATETSEALLAFARPNCHWVTIAAAPAGVARR